MFDIRHQEQRISDLKERLHRERAVAANQLRTIVPQTRRAAAVGAVAWSARKALPLLQPLLFAFIRRRAGGAIGARLVKALGLATLVFGVWRTFRSDNGEDG